MQSRDHHSGKSAIGLFWRRRGYSTLYEAGRCDVVCWRTANGCLDMVCSEYERSTRNLLRNYARNRRAARTRTKFLIVVPDEALRGAARRMLKRALPRGEWTRIAIVLLANLQKHIR